MSETTYSVSTLPLDLNLWHCCFIHHNYADVRAILSKLLITGLKLNSDASPDPICEPCLAGKMHALPFRFSLSHNCSPLELVHSDLHGLLPVATHSGYKYWITFIDNATCFRAVYLLKAKSEAFKAFKVYKSWAENQLGVKLRALQDNKGSEYMSKAFLAFTEAAGIERRHSTRNRPQQNGLAEQANRTMGERITAMLSES
jgi:transposase InsO family protein